MLRPHGNEQMRRDWADSMGIRYAVEGDGEGRLEIEGGMKTKVVRVRGTKESERVKGVVGELGKAESGSWVDARKVRNRVGGVRGGL